MRTFDDAFFKELSAMDTLTKLNEYDSILMPPDDGFRLKLSEVYEAGKISRDFVRRTECLTETLALRSNGRYLFEKDFRVRPYQVFSHSQGQAGRKQLHITLDAMPLSEMFPYSWGVSIGLGFDFRNDRGIVTDCVNDYEAFYERVFVEPELFDDTFGSLGYAEGFLEPITAERVWKNPVDMLQHWLFFGKRLTPEGMMALGSLDDFIDECFRVFDAICAAGYYDKLKQTTTNLE